MKPRSLGLWALCLILPCAVAPDAVAQIKASERGGVHQTIDGTTITIDYARPRARGRSPLFGGDVVHWDHVWTPGADWATTLEIDKPVKIQDTDIPVGKYSVWFVVQDSTSWEVWLEPKDSLFHIPEPERNEEQIHFWADVEQRDPFLETLTWSFQDLKMDGATIVMQWGTTYVPLAITVEPTIELIVATEIATPILGTYEMTGEGDRPWWNRNVSMVYDTTRSWVLSTWSPREMEESEDATNDPDDGDADSDEDANSDDEEDDDDGDRETWYAALFAVTDEWFTPGWMEDGEMWSVTKSMTLEFEFEDGRAVGYELRNRKDAVVATAKRIE
jgi:hypothetical protein